MRMSGFRGAMRSKNRSARTSLLVDPGPMESPTSDPSTCRLGRHLLFEALEHLAQTVDWWSPAVDLDGLEQGHREVLVRVDEPGDDRLALQVDDIQVRALQADDVLVGPDPSEILPSLTRMASQMRSCTSMLRTLALTMTRSLVPRILKSAVLSVTSPTWERRSNRAG